MKNSDRIFSRYNVKHFTTLLKLFMVTAWLSMPVLHAQEINTTDSLLWKKQPIEQIIRNEHNQKGLPDVQTTYTLLDTLHAPADLRKQVFLANDQGVFQDSVWTQFRNPNYVTGIDAVSSDAPSEELKLVFDGSQFKFEGTTSIRPEVLSIFSATGQKVFSEKIDYYDPLTRHSEAIFPFNNFSSGFYILTINNNPSYSLKFIKMQEGLTQPGSKREITQPSRNHSLKSLALDDPVTDRYERSFENTKPFLSFPPFKDTIAIPSQDDVFQTTTLIPDVDYLYKKTLKGTPGATCDVSFQGKNDATDFSLTVPSDSLLTLPQVADKDDKLTLKLNEHKLGWDKDSTSWLLSAEDTALLEFYLDKTKLPHSFSGEAFAGTQITFTLPDTTITTTAGDQNTFQTDTVWRSDSTFYDVLGYAVLNPYPAIADTFDADFGNEVRNYLVDTTLNGFNLLFKGLPSTDLEVTNNVDGTTLFDGTIAQDSTARVPGYRSLEDHLSVTVTASLPWYHDSTFVLQGLSPGTTMQDIYLKRKTYDFDVTLTTNPEVRSTGTFGKRTLDTLYADAQGKLHLPSQQFFQPDSLQELSLRLEKDNYYIDTFSVQTKPGTSSYEHFLTPYRFANVKGTIRREDGKPVRLLHVQLKNLLHPEETYNLSPVDSTFAVDSLFLSKTGLSDPYQVTASLDSVPVYVGEFVDTVRFDEGVNNLLGIIPVIEQSIRYQVIARDATNREPLKGVRVRAMNTGGGLWDSEVTGADGRTVLEGIPADSTCRIEFGFKGSNPSYFANWNDLPTPAMVTSEEDRNVALPIVLYRKNRAVPGTYDSTLQRSDSLVVSANDIGVLSQTINLEFAKRQPINIYIRFIDNIKVDTTNPAHQQVLAFIDDVIAKDNKLFGTGGLVRRVHSMYTLTPEDIARYTMQPLALQDSIISWFDYGSASGFDPRIITTPSGVTGILNDIVGDARNENALTAYAFGSLLGLGTDSRSDSYLYVGTINDPTNPPTVKDRVVANALFLDTWNRFYYKIATFDLTHLKETMVDWVNDK